MKISVTELAQDSACRKKIDEAGTAVVTEHGRSVFHALSSAEWERYSRLVEDEQLREEQIEVRAIYDSRVDDLDGPYINGAEHTDEVMRLVEQRLATLSEAKGE